MRPTLKYATETYAKKLSKRLIIEEGQIELSHGPRENRFCPAVDASFVVLLVLAASESLMRNVRLETKSLQPTRDGAFSFASRSTSFGPACLGLRR